VTLKFQLQIKKYSHDYQAHWHQVKHLLVVAEMTHQGLDGDTVDTNIFMECLHTVGY
jgi:hypothetical protein